MTAPLPLPPPRDAENITTREYFTFTRTGTNGGPVTPSTAVIKPVVVAVPIKNGDDIDVFYAMPSGVTDPGWPVVRYDSRGNNQVRIVTTVTQAGAAGAEVYGEYSTNGSVWATPSSADVKESLAVVKTQPDADAGWVTLITGAVGDVLWRQRLRGGDASASPGIQQSHFQFRQKTAVPPNRTALIGDPILDLDASRETGYGDGDTVPVFQDWSVSDNDAAPSGPLSQLAGSFELDKFGPGLHAVAIDDAGAGYRCLIPAIDSFTYFFVIGDVTGMGTNGAGGAANANICLTPDGDASSSFTYTIRGDGKVTAAMNGNVFDGSNQQVSSGAYDGAPLRIHKLAFWRTAGVFTVDIDGFRAINGTCAASLMVLAETIILGNAAGLSNLILMSMAEVLCYNGALIPEVGDAEGALGDSILAALQAKWGL